MLRRLEFLVLVLTPSRASPLPQWPVSFTNPVPKAIPVGAGLPAKRPVASMQNSGLGQRRQIPGQPQSFTHEQGLGFRHLLNHFQAGITQPAHR